MSEKSPMTKETPIVMDAKLLRRNLRIIQALAFFHMFMLIGPFFESKGPRLSEIFYLQAVNAGVIVLFEAPSG